MRKITIALVLICALGFIRATETLGSQIDDAELNLAAAEASTANQMREILQEQTKLYNKQQARLLKAQTLEAALNTRTNFAQISDKSDISGLVGPGGKPPVSHLSEDDQAILDWKTVIDTLENEIKMAQDEIKTCDSFIHEYDQENPKLQKELLHVQSVNHNMPTLFQKEMQDEAHKFNELAHKYNYDPYQDPAINNQLVALEKEMKENNRIAMQTYNIEYSIFNKYETAFHTEKVKRQVKIDTQKKKLDEIRKHIVEKKDQKHKILKYEETPELKKALDQTNHEIIVYLHQEIVVLEYLIQEEIYVEELGEAIVHKRELDHVTKEIQILKKNPDTFKTFQKRVLVIKKEAKIPERPKKVVKKPVKKAPAPKKAAKKPVKKAPVPKKAAKKPVKKDPAPKKLAPVHHIISKKSVKKTPVTPNKNTAPKKPVKKTPAPKKAAKKPVKKTPAPKKAAKKPVKKAPAPKKLAPVQPTLPKKTKKYTFDTKPKPKVVYKKPVQKSVRPDHKFPMKTPPRYYPQVPKKKNPVKMVPPVPKPKPMRGRSIIWKVVNPPKLPSLGSAKPKSETEKNEDLIRAILVHQMQPQKAQEPTLHMIQSLIPVVNQWIFVNKNRLSPSEYKVWTTEILDSLKKQTPAEAKVIHKCKDLIKKVEESAGGAKHPATPSHQPTPAHKSK